MGRWTGEHFEKRKGRKVEYRSRLKGGEVNRWKCGRIGGQVDRCTGGQVVRWTGGSVDYGHGKSRSINLWFVETGERVDRGQADRRTG